MDKNKQALEDDALDQVSGGVRTRNIEEEQAHKRKISISQNGDAVNPMTGSQKTIL